MLHTALATAPDRPMVPVAAVVASIALAGAALVFAARALTASGDPPAHRAHPVAAARSVAPAPVPAPVALPAR
jgi:hypothetical protein